MLPFLHQNLINMASKIDYPSYIDYNLVFYRFWYYFEINFGTIFQTLGIKIGGGSLPPTASGDCLLKCCLWGASATLSGRILGPFWNNSSTVLEANQPTNQSTINQSINQSTTQPINHLTNQKKPTNQSPNQSINQPINQPTHQSMNQPAIQPTNQPTNHSTTQPTNQASTQDIPLIN